jgi:hypothetical protein
MVFLSTSCPTWETDRILWTFHFFRDYSKVNFHSVGCPYSSAFKKLDVFGVQLRYSNALLNWILKASISINRGAGGCSISPGLQFRPTVPWNSPAFELLRRIQAHYSFGEAYTSYSGKYIDDTLQQLHKLLPRKQLPPSTLILVVIPFFT